jgi:hypothetical protein
VYRGHEKNSARLVVAASPEAAETGRHVKAIRREYGILVTYSGAP